MDTKTIRDTNFNNLEAVIEGDNSEEIILNYTPNLMEFDHYHINLNKGQATKLRDFLNKFLEKN